MITKLGLEENNEWRCLPCDELLKLNTVEINYLHGRFTVELPCCPSAVWF